MKKSRKLFQIRQGDVLLTRVKGERPSGLTKVPAEHGRTVLAHGEVTGHAHTLPAEDATLFGPSEDAFWLTVERDSELTHQEHAAIAIPAGTYRVTRQREYSPEEIRNVAD